MGSVKAWVHAKGGMFATARCEDRRARHFAVDSVKVTCARCKRALAKPGEPVRATPASDVAPRPAPRVSTTPKFASRSELDEGMFVVRLADGVRHYAGSRLMYTLCGRSPQSATFVRDLGASCVSCVREAERLLPKPAQESSARSSG